MNNGTSVTSYPDFEVKPYVGVNAVRFGMSRSEARLAMGRQYAPVAREAPCGPCDWFCDSNVVFRYDRASGLEIIELTNDVPIVVLGQRIERMNYEETYNIIRVLDPNTRRNLSDFTSDALGVACNLSGDDETFEAFGIFRRGYYD